jgi:hypothetical protein
LESFLFKEKSYLNELLKYLGVLTRFALNLFLATTLKFKGSKKDTATIGNAKHLD